MDPRHGISEGFIAEGGPRKASLWLFARGSAIGDLEFAARRKLQIPRVARDDNSGCVEWVMALYAMGLGVRGSDETADSSLTLGMTIRVRFGCQNLRQRLSWLASSGLASWAGLRAARNPYFARRCAPSPISARPRLPGRQGKPWACSLFFSDAPGNRLP